jgi:hypothetical protein
MAAHAASFGVMVDSYGRVIYPSNGQITVRQLNFTNGTYMTTAGGDGSGISSLALTGPLAGSYSNGVLTLTNQATAGYIISSLNASTGLLSGVCLSNATVGIAAINAGGSPGSNNFLRGDGLWTAPIWSGNAVLSFNGQTGYVVQPIVTSVNNATGSVAAVNSLNTLTGAVNLVIGEGLKITTNGNTLTITTNGYSVVSASWVSNTVASILATNKFNGSNIWAATIGFAKINATGDATSNSFLRGDWSWAVPSTNGGSGSPPESWGAQTGSQPELVSAGSGYTVSDTLTLSGGSYTSPITITVNAVDESGAILNTSGAPTDYQYATLGNYTVKPANAVSVTGGTGAGATFNITWQTPAP